MSYMQAQVEPYEDYPTVGDLQALEHFYGANYQLVTNSQDILIVLEMEGREELMSDVGCLFVIVGEGEYLEIWGCEESVPYLDAYIWRIK